MNRKFAAAIISILISLAFSFAETVDFYATVSSSADDNMIKMTTDLLFTQFQSMDGYSVVDRRSESFTSPAGTKNIAFYAEVQEDTDGDGFEHEFDEEGVAPEDAAPKKEKKVLPGQLM